jgi:excisionase family DNA binding protein
MTTTKKPILLTPEEVADLLRVHVRSIYRRVKHGQIPGVVKLGTTSQSMLRFRADDIYRWIDGK